MKTGEPSHARADMSATRLSMSPWLLKEQEMECDLPSIWA
jgi:hypothetical protein